MLRILLVGSLQHERPTPKLLLAKMLTVTSFPFTFHPFPIGAKNTTSGIKENRLIGCQSFWQIQAHCNSYTTFSVKELQSSSEDLCCMLEMVVRKRSSLPCLVFSLVTSQLLQQYTFNVRVSVNKLHRT